ncbi:unnamed protein product [Sphagnum tenellum]
MEVLKMLGKDSDGEDGEENVLGWEVCYKVAVGICKALEYLHDGSPRSVIHRDVKPPIYFYPMTSDLRFFLHLILETRTGFEGLSGFVLATWAPKRPMYLDPEYAIAGRFSDKSDVYSFGVILLELITGCKPIDFSRSTDERILVTLVCSAVS